MSATLLLFASLKAYGVRPPAPHGAQTAAKSLVISVLDENSVAIASARVVLEQVESHTELKGQTDYAGRCEFRDLAPGSYDLRVEKEGFYAVVQKNVRPAETEGLEVTLNHQQEYRESVNVVASPPSIDPAKTTASEELTNREIIELPYTVARDVRYALPLLPGVLQDGFGQIHVDGSSTRQIYDQLDGFNITDPVNGLFNVRVSVDAVRSVNVQSSRYPVEYGKGSGGILSLMTGMGDDRLRFSATNFTPSLQSRKGIHLNNWTPRITLSGPLRKGKAWFIDALEGEYDVDIVQELARGADRNTASRISNLAKAQVNLSESNILTTSFLINGFHSPHLGLTGFNPIEATVSLNNTAYLVSMKDQALLSRETLFEIGVALSRYFNEEHPQGSLPYVITPNGATGNFFETARRRAKRFQGVANLILPHVRWHGQHEFKMGTDADRITYTQSFLRNPFLILRADGTLDRRLAFTGNSSFRRDNVEWAGYAQDRWSFSGRWLVEPGVRLDWDQILRRPVASPRLAATWLPTPSGETKLAFGIGKYFDATNLQFITSPLTGERIDYFYDLTGQTLVRPPVEIVFLADERRLREPRFINWSAGLERKLARATTLKVEFVQKRGRNGWAFVNLSPTQPGTGTMSGLFDLRTVRQDHYDAYSLALRHNFKTDHYVFASYTRSSARSSAVLNFNLENVLFSQQAGGRLPWDSPNRLISWGWLPLKKGFDFAYWLDWRDGFPFSVFNQDQQLVGPPGSRRFPTFFSLNTAVERRLRLFGFQWALRAGLDDITNRHNPSGVNANVDSPRFLTFGGLQGRTVSARVRLLGRK